jgi:hypothetical protein
MATDYIGDPPRRCGNHRHVDSNRRQLSASCKYPAFAAFSNLASLGDFMVSLFSLRAVIAGAICLCLAMLSTTALAAQPRTRPFQMSILSTTDGIYRAGVDIPIFTRNVFSTYQDQPAGLSIAWLPPSADLDRHKLDWTRIVAVYVDEPYGEFMKKQKSCEGLDEATRVQLEDTKAQLEAMATALRAKAPATKFWVNFTRREIELTLDPAARCPFNQPYIDVISMDIYGIDFWPKIDKLYRKLYKHRATPHQQLALVPGTFTGGWEQQTGEEGASRLSGYFKYAARMNRRCNLPLGPTGPSGIYDGCPVWIVAGWIGGERPLDEDPRTYIPLDNPASKLVFEAWQEQIAIPRIVPTHAPPRRQAHTPR